MAQEKILIDFTQFPLTHELIFKKILFYSGGIMSEDSKRWKSLKLNLTRIL